MLTHTVKYTASFGDDPTDEVESHHVRTIARILNSTSITCSTPGMTIKDTLGKIANFSETVRFRLARRVSSISAYEVFHARETFFTYYSPLRVESIHPLVGTASGGTVLILLGSGFLYSKYLSVKFWVPYPNKGGLEIYSEQNQVCLKQ